MSEKREDYGNVDISCNTWTGTKGEAITYVGGLSQPAKMPCRCLGLPPASCKRGSVLRKIKGTICSKCYAQSGRYCFPNIKKAQQRRLAKYYQPRWMEAMVAAIGGASYFRWFDTGDLQSVEMLGKIAEICRRTPNCAHWLATREVTLVKEYLAKDTFPVNLNVRISADYIDEPIVESPVPGCTLSTVSSSGEAPGAYNCPATFGDSTVKNCKEAGCRACWKKQVSRVNYKEH